MFTIKVKLYCNNSVSLLIKGCDVFKLLQVLRKKYYNMVEDMKGKIRVYCRVRPMSKVELGNVNF